MGGCRCSYKNCKSATKTADNLHFFHYPVKHTERCRKWIENAAKPGFFNLAEDQLRNKVVCELHFEDRCFTNSQKKRLLHDAVPTLDAGAEDELLQSQRSFGDVQILPASADGTLFTVDTDSMQQVPESDKVESYIYRNGALLPLTQIPEDTEEIVYTMANEGGASFRIVADPPSYEASNNEVLFEEVKDGDEPRSHFHVVYNDYTSAVPHKKVVSENTTKIVEKPPPIVPNIKIESMQVDDNSQDKKSKRTPKKFVQQIKQHSKDIATIKQLLKSQNAIHKPLNRTTALNLIRKLVPPSLFNVIKLNISKSDVEFTSEEMDFFRDVNSLSPEVYNLLQDKYNWILPDEQLLEETVVSNK